MVWDKLWIELSLRVLILWYSEIVRLKGLDTYYSNLEISYDLEYSTCEYYIIWGTHALFNIFGLKIAVLTLFDILCHIRIAWSILNVTKRVFIHTIGTSRTYLDIHLITLYFKYAIVDFVWVLHVHVQYVTYITTYSNLDIWN